jgi:hypothetical protein
VRAALARPSHRADRRSRHLLERRQACGVAGRLPQPLQQQHLVHTRRQRAVVPSVVCRRRACRRRRRCCRRRRRRHRCVLGLARARDGEPHRRRQRRAGAAVRPQRTREQRPAARVVRRARPVARERLQRVVEQGAAAQRRRGRCVLLAGGVGAAPVRVRRRRGERAHAA